MARVYGKVSIYAMKDPATHRIFYVGRSQRPQSRFLEHLAEAERYRIASEDMLTRLFGIQVVQDNRSKDGSGNAKKLKWIISIFDRDEQPEFVILDEWVAPTMQDANRLEDAWIAELRSQGHPLTNVIYSRRMNPNWYGEKNPYYRHGWATSPTDYIARLKAGTVGSATKTVQPGDDEEQRPGQQFSLYQKKRIANRIQKQNRAAAKKKTPAKRAVKSRTKTRTTTRRKR
jgi:hypothetical protein